MSNFASPGRLYFFFDYISHNAWLAWNKIHALAEKHGLTVEPVPVIFGVMLSAYGQVGPAELPVKGRWMLWNVLRKAKLHNIPLRPPATHPFNPLLPLRVSCLDLPQAQRRDLIHRLFAATWAQSRAVSEEATVAEVLTEAGLDATALLEQARGDAIKARLRNNNESALASGVFGVPTMLVRGPGSPRQSGQAPADAELFWGFDDLPYLEGFLEGRDPLSEDRSAYAEWFAIKPSVQRKR